MPWGKRITEYKMMAVIKALKDNPYLSCVEIGRDLGVGVNSVRKIAQEHSLQRRREPAVKISESSSARPWVSSWITRR